MSETMRQSWDETWRMQVTEFLNVVCYIKDKSEHNKQELERWQRTH